MYKISTKMNDTTEESSTVTSLTTEDVTENQKNISWDEDDLPLGLSPFQFALAPQIVYVTIIALLGLTTNGLIIIVYRKKIAREKTAPNLLILLLGVVDLVRSDNNWYADATASAKRAAVRCSKSYIHCSSHIHPSDVSESVAGHE